MPYADIAGISLYYEDSAAGPPNVPPILLLHELGGSSESWRSVITRLAPRRRVIAMDYRGAGRSEKPREAFAFAQLADDAAEFLANLGVIQADVIGAAMGSLVGVALAARHPARVRSLALFAVAADMTGRTAAYLIERAASVRAEGMRPVAAASIGNAFPAGFGSEAAQYRPLYLSNDPVGYAALSIALAEAEFPPDLWRAIQVPTTIFSGAHDFIWPPSSGRHVASLIRGARFEILGDAGHFPHLQTPAAVTAGFLSAQYML